MKKKWLVSGIYDTPRGIRSTLPSVARCEKTISRIAKKQFSMGALAIIVYDETINTDFRFSREQWERRQYFFEGDRHGKK